MVKEMLVAAGCVSGDAYVPRLKAPNAAAKTMVRVTREWTLKVTRVWSTEMG